MRSDRHHTKTQTDVKVLPQTAVLHFSGGVRETLPITVAVLAVNPASVASTAGAAPGGKLTPRIDADVAITFLKAIRPQGPWVLTTIIPDGNTATQTFYDEEGVRSFVEAFNQSRNIYYTGNLCGHRNKKPSKADINGVIFLHTDDDPRDGETPAAAKARIIAAYEAHNPPPSIIVDSGNGLQGLWLLDEDYPILRAERSTPDTKKQVAEQVAEIEDRTRALVASVGGTPGTHNIDRLLRLPGTINHPNAKKLEKGRVACQASIVRISDVRYSLDQFPKMTQEERDNSKAASVDSESELVTTKIDLDWNEVDKHAGWLKNEAELPSDFSAKGKIIVAHKGTVGDLSFDLEKAGLIEKPYHTWSHVSFALAAIFKADGRYSNEQIAAALMCDLECNYHITKHTDMGMQRRAVERCLSRSYEPQRIAQVLPWRECNERGDPRPSMHNARLAIAALGVECSFDTFHSKMLFGFEDDDVRHTLGEDEITDNGIIRLRQMISDRFKFDMGDRYTRDGVVSLALDHCFDPVRDMLDKAQADYDGVKRLDKMAVTHINCADTPLNRAVIRKTMIAAVRRARHPGCKFDNITVFESEEGWNKSTFWRVMAGDENFSDASIIGHGAREVQEQLAEIWIHENADLAGMKKADVDSVKSFASRISDNARPAYGHFFKKQKRHSIEVGTTNNDMYLQSQTGNRRFWPLVILKMIDIALIKRDRLQLWGEAAKYEAEGESIVLNEKLWPAAAKEQEKRRVKDPWEDIVADMPTHVEIGEHGDIELKHLEPGKEPEFTAGSVQIIYRSGDRELVASTDVLKYVLGVPIDRQNVQHAMRLSNVMRLTGWKSPQSGRIRIGGGKQVRGYFRPRAK
jgi:predicted P-loop ATPase